MRYWVDAQWFARRMERHGAPRLADAFLDAFVAATTGTVVYAGGHARIGDGISEAVRRNNDRLSREGAR